MRILNLTENLFPDVMGGSGRMVADSSKALAKLGVEMVVLTRQIPGLSHQAMDAGVEILRYRYRPIWNLLVLRKMVAHLLKVGRWDAIFIHQPLPSLFAFLGGKNTPPKIRFFHGPWHDEYRRKRIAGSCGWLTSLGAWMRRGIDRWSLRTADKVVVWSSYMASQAESLCEDVSGKLFFIDGAVDAERFRMARNRSEIRRSLNLPLDRKIFFTVRNLTSRMGVDVLVEAAALVLKRDRECLFLAGGDGYLRPQLEAMIERLGLADNFKLLGRVKDKDLPLYYQSADLFILPTQDLEGFGLVILEALACGVPVLGTPQGAIPEVLGKIFPDGILNDKTSVAIAAGIMDFLGSQSAWRELAAQASVLVRQEYSLEKQAARLLEILA